MAEFALASTTTSPYMLAPETGGGTPGGGAVGGGAAATYSPPSPPPPLVGCGSTPLIFLLSYRPGWCWKASAVADSWLVEAVAAAAAVGCLLGTKLAIIELARLVVQKLARKKV